VVAREESEFASEEKFLFVYHLYKQTTDDSVESSVLLWDLAQQLEYSALDVKALADSLQKQSLLTFVSISGKVELSSLGQFEVMLALSQPDRATQFFPSLNSFTRSHVSFDILEQSEWLSFVDQLHDFSSTLSTMERDKDDLFDKVAYIESKVKQNQALDHVLLDELMTLNRFLEE